MTVPIPPTADEIVDRLLSGRPPEDGGAKFVVRDIDDVTHEPVTRPMHEALEASAIRQRRIEAKLDHLLALVEAPPGPQT